LNGEELLNRPLRLDSARVRDKGAFTPNSR